MTRISGSSVAVGQKARYAVKALHLIELFLKQEILEDMKLWNPISGTPQGAFLSPLPANVYLHQLDLVLHRHGFKYPVKLKTIIEKNEPINLCIYCCIVLRF